MVGNCPWLGNAQRWRGRRRGSVGSGKLDQMIPKVSFKVELLKGEI